MALALSTIQAIAARKGNEYLQQQINLKAQILGSKALEKQKVDGAVRIINVQASGLDSVAILQGGDAYPGLSGGSTGAGSGNQATQLVARPANFVGLVRIPFDSAEVVTGKADSINLVKNQFELIGRNLGQQIGRSIFSPIVAVALTAQMPATVAAGASGTLTGILDCRGFRVGQVYDMWATSAVTSGIPTLSGSAAVTQIKVTSVTFSSASSGAGDVAFTNVGSAATGTAADRAFTLRGSLDSSAAEYFTSLSSAVGSGNLYGTAVSGADWSGNDFGTLGSTALTPGAMREVVDTIQARSGENLRCVVMSPLAFTEYELACMAGGASNAGGGTRFFGAGDKLDPFGKNGDGPMFMGKPIIVDDNCPTREVYFIGENAVELGEWREVAPLVKDRMAEVSQTAYEYQIKCAGMANLVVKKRAALGRLKIALS